MSVGRVIEGKAGHYEVGKIVAEFAAYRIYVCIQQETGRQCLLQIATSAAENGRLERAAFILGEFKSRALELEAEFAKIKTDPDSILNYDLCFPEIVDTFIFHEEGDRRINILGFKSVEEMIQLVPLSNIVEIDRMRVDLRTSGWIMGKLLKFLVFSQGEMIALNSLPSDNILIEPNKHFVLIFDLSDAEVRTEPLTEKERSREIAQMARAVIYVLGLGPTMEPFAGDDVVSAFAIISRRAGGVILFQIVNFTLLVANMGSGMGSQLAAGRLLYGMGRGNALPKSFFGVIEPKHRVPRNNIIAVGAFALAGAGLLEFFANRLGGGAYEIGAQCLNFGAFIAFMGVNAAAFVHHWRLKKSEPEASCGNLSGLVSPALGFLICGFIWLNLSLPAKVLGFVWMAAGITYGAIRTRGFRSELVTFEVPSDVA